MTLTSEELVILLRVLAAVVAGALIGFERTFHGRPAGFRTHALVCVASSLRMLVRLPEPMDDRRPARCHPNRPHAHGAGHHDGDRLPRRRGDLQGGADWITAAIGILLGIGFYFAATLGTAATIAILAAFRFIELCLPTEFYAYHSLVFERGAVMAEDDLRRVVGEHGFSIANLSYHLSAGGKFFEYGMVIKSRDRRNADALSQHLSKLPEVLEFRIDPMGD